MIEEQKTVRWEVWICNAAGWKRHPYVTHMAASCKAKLTHKRFIVEGPTPRVKDEYKDGSGVNPAKGI